MNRAVPSQIRESLDWTPALGINFRMTDHAAPRNPSAGYAFLVRQKARFVLLNVRVGLLLPVALAIAVLLYVVSYYQSEFRPRVGARYPLGWWGWFDQGEYIKSVRALTHFDFASSEHLYPPLYNFIAAPFLFLTKDHPHFIPNLIFFTFYVYVFLNVARKYYGVVAPAAALICILGFLPTISLTQWVIPWTTSLQAALVSCLILVFSRFEARNSPFHIGSRADWLSFTAFFVAYGALAPTRPLDLVVWFPFALYFFMRVLVSTVKITPQRQRVRIAAFCCAAAAIGGSLFVLFYLAFNFAVFGSPFGAYLGLASRNPYLPLDVVEKAYSIFLSSGPLYGEQGQAFVEKIPAAASVLALCVVSLIYTRDLRRWICLTAFVNFMIYLPYGDLLPTGVFRYYNLHYFKWAYPWLTVIAVGQAWLWIKGSLQRKDGARPLVISTVVLALVLSISIVPADAERVRDTRRIDQNVIAVRTPRERQADFVDLFGVEGDFISFYFGNHRLSLDGAPVELGSFRVLPIAGGARLLFLRPRAFSELELSLDPKINLGRPQGSSIISSYRYALGCSFQECSQLPVIAWTDGAIQVDLRSGGAAEGLKDSQWWGAEPWGRWSKETIAGLELRLEPRPAVVASATVTPLLAPKRPTQPVSLLVNGCLIASAEFTLAESGPRKIEGPIPTNCLRSDGRLKFEIRTDTVRSPAALKINRDPRKLGVGISEIILQEAATSDHKPVSDRPL